MPIAYNPAHFWSVIFTRTGSKIPCIMHRVLVVYPSTIGAYLVERYTDYLDDTSERELKHLLVPLSAVVSLLLAFRINDAFGKWNQAAHMVSNMQTSARCAMAMLIAYTPANPSKDAKLCADLLQIRRHLVLSCVMIRKHVRGEKDFKNELEWEVITKHEVELISKVVTSVSRGDGKKDKFPTKNRPALVFQWLHCATMELFREGKLPSPPHHMAIDSTIRTMSEMFEEVEHLGQTIAPLYARWIFEPPVRDGRPPTPAQSAVAPLPRRPRVRKPHRSGVRVHPPLAGRTRRLCGWSCSSSWR